MYGGIFNFVANWLVIYLTGVVIKLMDDYLDQELDKIEGKHTLAMVFDKAVLPYSLICMVISMSVKPALAGSLFLASYVIGMGHNLKQPLPLGGNALQEFIIFMIFGIMVFGFKEMTGSLMIIIFIQLLDDFFDYYTDTKFSRRNFVIRFGFWESVMACGITFFVALIMDWQKTFLVCISLPMVLFTLERGKRYIKNV